MNLDDTGLGKPGRQSFLLFLVSTRFEYIDRVSISISYPGDSFLLFCISFLFLFIIFIHTSLLSYGSFVSPRIHASCIRVSPWLPLSPFVSGLRVKRKTDGWTRGKRNLPRVIMESDWKAQNCQSTQKHGEWWRKRLLNREKSSSIGGRGRKDPLFSVLVVLACKSTSVLPSTSVFPYPT